MNYEVTKEKVRLVDVPEEAKDITTKVKAVEYAESLGLDLVEMSVNGEVSICKIFDYQKHLYNQKKAKKEQKKKHKSSTLKEIKFGCNIMDHDLETNCKKAMNILKEGDKVKVAVVFKGRQMMYANKFGPELLDKFMGFITDSSIFVSKSQSLEGNMYSMILEKK